MKSLFNNSRSAIQFVATLAIALSGALVMTQEATQFNDPQFKAEIVIAQDDGSLDTRGEATQSADGTNTNGREQSVPATRPASPARTRTTGSSTAGKSTVRSCSTRSPGRRSGTSRCTAMRAPAAKATATA